VRVILVTQQNSTTIPTIRNIPISKTNTVNIFENENKTRKTKRG